MIFALFCHLLKIRNVSLKIPFGMVRNRGYLMFSELINLFFLLPFSLMNFQNVLCNLKKKRIRQLCKYIYYARKQAGWPGRYPIKKKPARYSNRPPHQKENGKTVLLKNGEELQGSFWQTMRAKNCDKAEHNLVDF